MPSKGVTCFSSKQSLTVVKRWYGTTPRNATWAKLRSESSDSSWLRSKNVYGLHKKLWFWHGIFFSKKIYYVLTECCLWVLLLYSDTFDYSPSWKMQWIRTISLDEAILKDRIFVRIRKFIQKEIFLLFFNKILTSFE